MGIVTKSFTLPEEMAKKLRDVRYYSGFSESSIVEKALNELFGNTSPKTIAEKFKKDPVLSIRRKTAG